VYDELFVRHWDVFITPNKVSHIFLQRVQQTVTGEWALIGEPVDLMKGMKANSPVPPDGGSDHYDISPDGSKVAFCAGIVNRKQAWTTGWRTFVVNISPSISAPIDISASVTQARTQNPKFSPDGRTLAILYGTQSSAWG
jgi:Tol biopolymer transport system component